jgi:hypothetical protein
MGRESDDGDNDDVLSKTFDEELSTCDRAASFAWSLSRTVFFLVVKSDDDDLFNCDCDFERK